MVGCLALMLVVALQFYTGDWYMATKLARLFVGLEDQRRDDVGYQYVV